MLGLGPYLDGVTAARRRPHLRGARHAGREAVDDLVARLGRLVALARAGSAPGFAPRARPPAPIAADRLSVRVAPARCPTRHVVELAVVDLEPPALVAPQHVGEARVGDDVVERVLAAGVDGLADRLVEAGQAQEELGALLRAQALQRVGPVERALLVDQVHRASRSGRRAPSRSRTSGRSICRRSTSPSRVRSVTSSTTPQLRLDDPVAAPVGHPEHQVRDAVARRDA